MSGPGESCARARRRRIAVTRVPISSASLNSSRLLPWVLLRYRVAEMLGRRPSPQDLHSLAERYYPQFSKLIRGDQRQLEDTLLTVFAFAAEGRKVKGGNAVVMGSAALGVLLGDPAAELAAMRPHLAAWWEGNKAEFGRGGTR